MAIVKSEKYIWNSSTNAWDLVVNPDSLFYIAGTGSTAGTWLGSHNRIGEYYDGLTIAYKIPIAGASTTTLNINGLGARTVRRNTSNLTTQLPANTVVVLTYTTISSVGYWVWADYDANSNSSLMTQTAITNGVETAAREINALLLRNNFYLKSEADTLLNTKFNTPTGSTSQYVRGNGSLATFPTIPGIPDVMSVQEGADGTYTDVRTINAYNLRQIVEGLSPPGSRPASDVKTWAKADNKPAYSWSDIQSKPSFATVATSGSYADLSNKPTIPTIPALMSIADIDNTTANQRTINASALRGRFYTKTEIQDNYVRSDGDTGSSDGVFIGTSSSVNSFINVHLGKHRDGGSVLYLSPEESLAEIELHLDLKDGASVADNKISDGRSVVNKKYVDGLISSVYRPSGNWNASTNVPALANNTPANAGKVYRVSVAGTRFGFTFAIGDKLAFNESGIISKWDNVDDVVSVNGQVGTVVLTTDNVTQGSNLYVSQSEKNTWNGKFNTPTGSTSQYVRGNGSLATFPTIPGIPDVMSVQEGADGTYTDVRTINALNLRQIVEGLSPPGSRPASDVKTWAKADNKPAYNLDEISEGTTYKRVTQTEKNTWNGKVTRYASVNGLDMNNVTETGFYYGYNMTNAAVTTISTFIVMVYSGDWIVQKQFVPSAGGNTEFIRSRHSGTTWSAWTESASTSWVTANTRSSSWTPTWAQVSGKPSWIESSKPTYNLDQISEGSTYKRVTQTEKNTWSGKQNALGFTPENAANKRTSIRTSGANDTSYVSELGVKTYVDGLIGSAGMTATPIFVDGAGGETVSGITIYNPTQYKMISLGFAYGTIKCILTPSYGYFYGGITFRGTVVMPKNYVSGSVVRDFYLFNVYISGSSVYVEDAEAVGNTLNFDGSTVDDVVGFK